MLKPEFGECYFLRRSAAAHSDPDQTETGTGESPLDQWQNTNYNPDYGETVEPDGAIVALQASGGLAT